MDRFFDYNSTTPVDAEVLKKMLPYFSEVFANPSGQSSPMSWQSQSAIKTAKNQVSQLLDCNEEEIIFTSGATESINWVIGAFIRENKNVLLSEIDHDAAWTTACSLASSQTVFFDSDSKGVPDLASYSQKLGTLAKGSLVTLIYGHNELGTVIDVNGLAQIAQAQGHFVHIDATQAVGKLEFSFKDIGCDFLSCSAHKFYGPKGIGTLIVNKQRIGDSLPAQILGGGQQNGRRSGTLNTPSIVGMGQAAELAKTRLKQDQAHYLELRRVFLEALEGLDVHFNFPEDSCLANTLNLTFCEWNKPSDLFLELLPFSVSQGSACSSESGEARVLEKIGVKLPQGTIRVSFGRPTEVQGALDLANKIKSVLKST